MAISTGASSGDDKFMAAAFVANLIRYKQDGYKPDRSSWRWRPMRNIIDRDAQGFSGS
jgi:hypothetical protein